MIKIWHNKYKILGLFVFVLGITVPIVHFVLTEYYLIPKIESDYKKAQSYFPKILADLKAIAENPPFPDVELKSNGEGFISKHVSWEGDGFSPLSSKSHETLSDLFEKYPNWKSDPKQFKSLYADPDLLSIDTSWIEELKNYSHWDFSTHPEIQENLRHVPESSGIERIGIFSALPIPNFPEFRKWGIVYFLQEYHQGKGPEGLKSFRKMAHLSHNTGTLIGKMIATTMLDDEHFFSKNLQMPDWELIPKEEIQAYKRVSWAWIGIAQTTWFHEFPKDFEPYLKPETGVCAAAWENPGGLTAFQDFLKSKVVFERDFSENLEKSRSFQKRLFSICNMKSYEGFVSRIPAGANPLIGRGYGSYYMIDSEAASSSTSLNWSRVPYIRRVIGLNLIAISIPNYLKLYEQK